jgi:hypothetical protein
MRISHALSALFPVAMLLAAGCSDPSASVSGEVTYEGKAVKDGYVTFAPTDGKGPTVGGPIKDGRYSVENVPPGPKVVQVEASSGAGPSVQTTEDLERLSKEMKGKVNPDGIIRTETVPQDAEGNNQKGDLKAGSQTLDLHLEKPAKKK